MRSLGRFVLFSLGTLLCFSGVTWSAPPQVDRFFPAGGQIGQETTVQAEGKFDPWPVQVWSSHPGIVADCEEEKGKLRVRVDSQVHAGQHWLRLFNDDGTSVLRPFCVGTLPEVQEVEPNQDAPRATSLPLPGTANGKLHKSAEVDVFAVQLKEGQDVVVALRAHHDLGSPMDAVLQVCNAQGFVLAQNDDAVGLDPQLVFRAPSDGSYLVRLFAFPETPNSTIGFAGGSSFVYRLTVTSAGFLDYSMPMAVASNSKTSVALRGWGLPESERLEITPATSERSVPVFHPEAASALQLPVVDAQVVCEETMPPDSPLSLPVVVSGVIAAAEEVDVFRFEAKKGQKVTVEIESDSLGFSLDPHLVLSDAQGKQLAEVDDTNKQRDASLTHSIPADGVYHLVVRDAYRYGGPRHVYRMTMRAAEPDFRLTLAQEQFVLTVGKETEIPVAIDRQEGFKSEIEISLENLPDGIQVNPVTSSGEGDSAKSVKLKITATQSAAPRPIQIVGKEVGGDRIRTATYMTDAPKSARSDVWLTVGKMD